MVRISISLIIALCLVVSTAGAQDPRPRVPPGLDPGGVAIALLSTGIDYTLPALAARLARDGEGEIIAWDFEANDNRPFDRSAGQTPPGWGGDGTALATALVASPGVRLVAVRIVPGEPLSLARAAMFLSQTPARVVIAPMRNPRPQDWQPFALAAARFKDILFIVPASETEPASALENVITVGVSASGMESVGFGGVTKVLAPSDAALVAATKLAANALNRNPKASMLEIKRLIGESSGR
jgi:hypothetical protein